MSRVWLACVGLVAGALPCVASAQGDGQLRLFREPHSYTDVVDAFDDDDPFDINISLEFRHIRQWGTIQRERGTWSPSEDPNRLSRLWENVATHEHTQNVLELGLDVGIFRDLAIYGRMPIIFSDDRRIVSTSDHRPDQLIVDNCTPDGMGNCVPCQRTAGGACMPGTGPDGTSDPDVVTGTPMPPLFALDPGGSFAAPTRSGLDYIAAGLAWSIMNQHRERDLPTWVLMIEGRFNVGDPLVACRGSGGPQCRRWMQSGGRWSFDDGGLNAGMTRGTNALRIETRSSWRTEYVEPYAGLSFQIEWPAAAERFFLPAGNLGGIVNERPPIIGELTGGVAIHPWENRAEWQRLTIDLRFHGRYVSEGHGYSPLFDALGTSQNRYLTEPALEGDLSRDPSADLRTVPFFGLTDMQSHAELGMRVGVEVRALRYLRVSLGAAFWYVQPYIITYADACNPNFDIDATDPDRQDPRRGTCRDGIINPHHRPAIDLPGQRFRVDEQVRLDVQLAATAMF